MPPQDGWPDTTSSGSKFFSGKLQRLHRTESRKGNIPTRASKLVSTQELPPLIRPLVCPANGEEAPGEKDIESHERNRRTRSRGSMGSSKYEAVQDNLLAFEEVPKRGFPSTNEILQIERGDGTYLLDRSCSLASIYSVLYRSDNFSETDIPLVLEATLEPQINNGRRRSIQNSISSTKSMGAMSRGPTGGCRRRTQKKIVPLLRLNAIVFSGPQKRLVWNTMEDLPGCLVADIKEEKDLCTEPSRLRKSLSAFRTKCMHTELKV